ncbi:polysaccharide biosynthesis/export family protein [Paraburkholderia tropica]|uniref:polysaccharide biosynthesis/export family protein n=1 Tax=Paraburkholderia tropica TaxID=92647 RepID=UPI003D267C17
MRRIIRGACLAVVAGSVIGVAGCSWVPTSGPSRMKVSDAGAQSNLQGIQIVEVTDAVARQLYAERSSADFSKVLGEDTSFRQQLGVGDAVDISIWEAPPATLFGDGLAGAGAGDGLSAGMTAAASSGARVTMLPVQVVNGEGDISVPFVGKVRAAGRTPMQLQDDIASRLKSIAHKPQVMVRLDKNDTSYVTVVGDVASSTRMELSARGERLLDALAAAGGARDPIDKVTLQVTRGNTVASLPLQAVIRNPTENVPLHAGDVVTALFQPYSFTVLGATGKNDEINFEAQGITLAQALARSGGLQDSRSDAQGVFVFRLERANALNWPNQPVRTTADGKVPVIYRLNLRDPNSFFAVQSFMMDNRDLLYVSNAPITEIQKVLNLVFSVAYPIVNGVQTFK